MHLFQAIVILFAALSISAIAAYVSITGMMAVFPAEPVIVAIIMSTLEFGKIVAVEWLHSNWKNKLVGLWHKSYMLLAVAALMLITAIGIYGFFSKGYLEQSQPNAISNMHLSSMQNTIDVSEKQISTIDARLAALDSVVNRALDGKSDNSASRAMTISRQQKSERDALNKERSELVTRIASTREEMLPLTQSTLEVDAKMGPVKYLASLLGMTDQSSAIQLVIVVLMLAFDPFAICLVISASISFKTWSAVRINRTIKEQRNTTTDQLAAEPTIKFEEETTVDDSVIDIVDPVLEKPIPLKKRKPRKPKKTEDSDEMSLDDVVNLYTPTQDLDKKMS